MQCHGEPAHKRPHGRVAESCRARYRGGVRLPWYERCDSHSPVAPVPFFSISPSSVSIAVSRPHAGGVAIPSTREGVQARGRSSYTCSVERLHASIAPSDRFPYAARTSRLPRTVERQARDAAPNTSLPWRTSASTPIAIFGTKTGFPGTDWNLQAAAGVPIVTMDRLRNSRERGGPFRLSLVGI